MILSFAITGVSAQKIEWKYSTPNNYWETEKNIKWSDTPENSSKIIPISENKLSEYLMKKPNISMVWAVLSTNSDGTLYVLYPKKKRMKFFLICSARKNPTIPTAECLSEPVISL